MKTIASTVIPQLFNKVFKYPPKSKHNPFHLYGGINRPQHIDFDNGGRMTFGGMDDPGKVLGGEYDLVIFNQVERERKERAWTDLIGCGEGGRAGNWIVDGIPRFQIIGDANPDAPTHWLLGRVSRGQMKMIKFVHNDNPLLFYDGERTDQGHRTVDGLRKRYYGYMLLRMVEGEWVAASGIVYTMFNKDQEGNHRDNYHVKPVSKHDIGSDWRWFVSLDYGYNNPSVCQLWATSPDFSKHIMFREAYITAHHIHTFEPYIRNTISGDLGDRDTRVISQHFADHDPGYKSFLEEMGYTITDAPKKDMKISGIDICRDWLSKPENTVIFNSNALWHPPDPELSGGCDRTVSEFPLYAYREEDRRKGDYTDEDPVNKWDHGMDCMRYYFTAIENFVPYEPIHGSASMGMSSSTRGFF